MYSCRLSGLWLEPNSSLVWFDVSVLLNEPAVVVAPLEFEQGEAGFLEGVEVLVPEQLLSADARSRLGPAH